MKPDTHSSPIITVIGGGSWATAIVKILCENDVHIRWWLRNIEDVEYIRKFGHNPNYLSDVQINRRKVRTFYQLPKALEDATHVILAVPAAFIQDAMKDVRPEDLQGKVIISAIKGLIPNENILITDWVESAFSVPKGQICVIAGPCHAEEVALEKQSYLTIASTDVLQAAHFAKMMSCRFLQAHAIKDIYGVEYCAVMKNVIALACGIAHGLNYGDNFQAVLVSNSMQEIQRFVDAINPMQRDLMASAYLGDLLVTAYSQFSRNRTFGNMIGRGYSVKSAQVEMNMIAEGYYAIKSIFAINKQYQVNMPISKAVYRILYEKASPASEIQKLKAQLR
ncbi:NAD(P)H-dependent glycerol-3-phosphate dehydrogenase [Xanthocytophaga agilis]|uniref:Glycerol-3-phosphate dehydrogenase [NAD(P)+] n=1 Tax=Xanthocytophaga agilis TaxID=3048010 RepID=A0AAE3R866_9BACT|nr:NAD(P)H-dependent glycerol-3-phosphate dehydrogenase [Xanthocytophaga agilis]MDJ1502552.1 NAD(P)H-dependent glycerol-3-phosphate dehydrogenase [Xanthocytophaga agilis]